MPDKGYTVLGVDVIARDGFARFDGATQHPRIVELVQAPDWTTFAASWHGMPQDTYMADGGRYRRRRYAVFDATANALVRKPHEPHFQAVANNHLNGGTDRFFEPIPEAIAAGFTLSSLLSLCSSMFSSLSPDVRRWHVEVHQFRIEADQTVAGKPTPEGMHRDGVDFVLVLLVARENIASGTTTMADNDKRSLGSFTLVQPGDAVMLDDRRVFHGVTAVEAVDPERPAFRDVLVVTFADAATRPARV